MEGTNLPFLSSRADCWPWGRRRCSLWLLLPTAATLSLFLPSCSWWRFVLPPARESHLSASPDKSLESPLLCGTAAVGIGRQLWWCWCCFGHMIPNKGSHSLGLLWSDKLKRKRDKSIESMLTTVIWENIQSVYSAVCQRRLKPTLTFNYRFICFNWLVVQLKCHKREKNAIAICQNQMSNIPKYSIYSDIKTV